MDITYPVDYAERMKEYNKQVTELEAKRKKFYEENPGFPIKTMYMNVIGPPRKFVIRTVKH